MNWLELSISVAAERQAQVESALEDIGALAITLVDADADTPDERAIFEPGVGETPLWRTVVLQALFDGGSDRAGLIAALHELAPGFAPEQLTFREVADQDWTRAWMDQFQPMRFGERTWIVPSNQQLPPEADATRAVVVKLDPGLAFGSGTHPTTALCLAWLDGLDLSGKTVLDFGCGSGILALAALKLGAARAVGVDNDPQALTASVDNAQRNGVARKLAVYMPDDEPIEKYPVVVANILAVALDAHAAQLASRVETGGVIALSGILDGQDTELLLRYSAWFDELAVAKQGDWVRITGRRNASP
jgi:ribosomal protein L11 methyltransferase